VLRDKTPRMSKNSRSADSAIAPSKDNGDPQHRRVALYVFVLVDGPNRDYPFGWGHADSPSDGSTVQALRNARFVGEFAHGRDVRLAIAEFATAAQPAPGAGIPAPPFSSCFQRNRSRAGHREVVMPLKIAGTIAIPGAAGSEFDHAAFDAKSRRVFIAHTARDCVEVIDHDAGRHYATLP
jgi:hypothetical protein